MSCDKAKYLDVMIVECFKAQDNIYPSYCYLKFKSIVCFSKTGLVSALEWVIFKTWGGFSLLLTELRQRWRLCVSRI